MHEGAAEELKVTSRRGRGKKLDLKTILIALSKP
jgi:hypothetical protein